VPLEVVSRCCASTQVLGSMFGAIGHRDMVQVGIDIEAGTGEAERRTDLPDLRATGPL
jgi:hypothetical protein